MAIPKCSTGERHIWRLEQVWEIQKSDRNGISHVCTCGLTRIKYYNGDVAHETCYWVHDDEDGDRGPEHTTVHKARANAAKR